MKVNFFFPARAISVTCSLSWLLNINGALLMSKIADYADNNSSTPQSYISRRIVFNNE